MRHWIGIFAALALALTTLACGGSSDGATSDAEGDARVTAYFPHHENDRDNDTDHNNDDAHIIYFGHAANPTDRRQALALVRGYYAAAAAANGREACALLVPFFAESVVERYGQEPAVSGRTCAVVMSKLFRNHHALLLAENATFRIPQVRVQGDRGLAILEFPTISEVHQMILRRAGGAWRVLDLLDSIIE